MIFLDVHGEYYRCSWFTIAKQATIYIQRIFFHIAFYYTRETIHENTYKSLYKRVSAHIMKYNEMSLYADCPVTEWMALYALSTNPPVNHTPAAAASCPSPAPPPLQYCLSVFSGVNRPRIGSFFAFMVAYRYGFASSRLSSDAVDSLMSPVRSGAACVGVAIVTHGRGKQA